jgi:prevent-host-death family protein
MSIAEQMPLAEVKNRLSEVVEQVESQHARVTITKRPPGGGRHQRRRP